MANLIFGANAEASFVLAVFLAFQCGVASSQSLDTSASGYDRRSEIMALPYSQNTLAGYEAALKRNPRDYVALYRRGKHKEASNDLKGAIADFTKSLQFNPLKSEHCKSETSASEKTLRAWANQDLGYIYCMQGKYQMGVDALSRAIVLRPNYADNYQNRAAAYKILGMAELSRRDLVKAKYLRKAALTDDCLTAPISLQVDKYSRH